jgi:hypothetical protein
LPAALWYSDIFGARPVYDLASSLYSDAFAILTSGGGLGGYAYGLLWHVSVSRDEVQVKHIKGWEFVALAYDDIIFGPRMVGRVVSSPAPFTRSK